MENHLVCYYFISPFHFSVWVFFCHSFLMLKPTLLLCLSPTSKPSIKTSFLGRRTAPMYQTFRVWFRCLKVAFFWWITKSWFGPVKEIFEKVIVWKGQNILMANIWMEKTFFQPEGGPLYRHAQSQTQGNLSHCTGTKGHAHQQGRKGATEPDHRQSLLPPTPDHI